MRLISYQSQSQVRSARLIDGYGFDLNISAAFYKETNPSLNLPTPEFPFELEDWFLLGNEGLEYVQEATNWALDYFQNTKDDLVENGMIFDIKNVSLLAPIPRPGKVICIAGNFLAPGKMDKPEYPTVFLKPSGSVIGNGYPIVIPKVATNVAYEVELAVVIGQRSRDLKIDEVDSAIAGYTIANDIGDRSLEKRTSQWTSGKMFDTFTPMGPVLITPDELSDFDSLSMLTKVNGQLMQKGNTSEMFFDAKELVRYLSTLTTLEVGDVILTGSPKMMDGITNPLWNLSPEDLVEVNIEKLGALINPVISEEVTT